MAITRLPAENPWGSSSSGYNKPTKPPPEPKRLGDPSPTLSRRVGEKIERTKEAASAGMKKVKEGASTSVNWLKVKYNKSNLFQKK